MIDTTVSNTTDDGQALPDPSNSHADDFAASVKAVIQQTRPSHVVEAIARKAKMEAEVRAQGLEPRKVAGLPNTFVDPDEEHRLEVKRAHLLLALMIDRGDVSADQFLQAAWAVGGNWGPGMLWETFVSGALADGALVPLVSSVWSSAEYPQQQLPVTRWRALFVEAGFTIDGRSAERPTEPLTVYRGAGAARRRRMAWTTDRDTAQWFADRFAMLGPARQGQVWQAEPKPEQMLAMIDGEDSRKEAEVVLDTRGLKITAA